MQADKKTNRQTNILITVLCTSPAGKVMIEHELINLLSIKMKYKFIDIICFLSVQFCIVDVVNETEQPRLSQPQNGPPAASSSENCTSSKHPRTRRRLKVTDAVADNNSSVEDDKKLLIDIDSMSTNDIIPVGKQCASLKSEHSNGLDYGSPVSARDNLDVDEHGIFSHQSGPHLGLTFDQPASDEQQIAVVAVDELHSSKEVDTIRVSILVC